MADNNGNNTNQSAEPLTTQKLIAIFVAGAILCALIVWGIVSLRTNNADNATANATATSTASTTDQAMPHTSGQNVSTANPGTFSVASQPAGMSVAISGISVASPRWIVVYDDNNGKPGNTLGASMVFPGQQMASVSLLRATVAGQTYMVGESETNNGSHVYSKAHMLIVPIWKTFSAQ